MALSQIISYNVGFGDCFLLKFMDMNNNPSFLLLDCGTRDGGDADWIAIANDISDELKNNNCTSISFMLTHLHYDHYVGFNHVRKKLIDKNITVNDFYISAKLSNDSFKKIYNDFMRDNIVEVSASNPPIIDNSITVLWPPEAIEEGQFRLYMKKHFPDIIQDEDMLYQKFTDGLSYNFDFWSIIFEVKGNNGKTYLFTGDFREAISVGSYNDEIKKLNEEIVAASFKMIFDNNRKYKMIKMPHHGTDGNLIDFIAEDGYMLISWREYLTSKGNVWADWLDCVKEFEKKISTNWHSNNPPYAKLYSEYPPYTNTFKIIINITQNGDKVSVYEEDNQDPIYNIDY